LSSQTCGDAWVDEVPPTVEFVDPLDGAVFMETGEITVTIAASDEGLGVTRVELFQDGESVGELAMEPFEFTIDLAQGTTELTAEAEDGAGLIGSAAITVEVVLPDEPPAQEEGCACGVSRTGTALPFLMLPFALALTRRRRPVAE
jgi:hypothetical protein